MKVKFVSVVAISCYLLVNSFNANASKSDYDKILTNNIDADGPGSAVIVSKNGEVLYKGARGLANIEHNIPLTTDSIFRLGSITKQFTGAAIMILHEQGKLSISDDIHKYVPDFPTEGNKITIEHLLTHTSGIANYTEDEHVWNNLIPTETTLDEMLLEFKKHPMKLKTGEKMRYSNTGYVLLGKIIEVASGQTYADFVEEHIFKKLGMKNSHYGGTQIIKNRASGYSKAGDEIANSGPINMMWPHAAGSLLSTVEDLNIWYTSLRSGKLISKESYQKMIAPYTLNDGSQSDYGYGLGKLKVSHYDAIGHGGGIHGFVTHAFYVPEKKLYVAVLNNKDFGNPRTLALRLAAEALEIELPAFKPAKIDEAILSPLLGTYKIDDKSVRKLLVEDGKYYTQRDDHDKWQVFPMSNNSFYYAGSLSYFIIEEDKEGQKVMNFYSDLSTTPSKATKQ